MDLAIIRGSHSKRVHDLCKFFLKEYGFLHEARGCAPWPNLPGAVPLGRTYQGLCPLVEPPGLFGDICLVGQNHRWL